VLAPPREHLAECLGLDAAEPDDAAPASPVSASPTQADTSNMDISPSTLSDPGPRSRDPGPQALYPAALRGLTTHLSSFDLLPPSCYQHTLPSALALAAGDRDAPEALRPRLSHILATTRFGNGIYLQDVINVVRLDSANPPEPPPLR
jgi:hypothetical protein